MFDQKAFLYGFFVVFIALGIGVGLVYIFLGNTLALLIVLVMWAVHFGYLAEYLNQFMPKKKR